MTTGVTHVSRHLRAAADLIEEHGHARGAYETEDGSVCAAAAIRWAAIGHRPSERWEAPFLYQDNECKDAWVTLFNWLMAQPEDVEGLISWNDSHTAAEVVAALRAAADDEDARRSR
jgi:hypothetical protein